MTVIVLKTIFYIMVWSVGGALILCICGVLTKFNDLSYVNPIKIYKTYHVNYSVPPLSVLFITYYVRLALLVIGFIRFVPLAASDGNISLYE